MGRPLTILFAMGFIVTLIAGVTAAAYGVGALAERYAFVGASRLTNVVFLMVVFVMVIATLFTIAERKWSALIQDRVGPNRARLMIPGLKHRALGGLPHLVADSLKMLFKENLVPLRANRILFNLGPVLAFGPVLALFAVIPVGPEIAMGAHNVELVVATPDFGLLYVFAIASLAVYGISLAGWSSNSKLALLGGVRASSQMISYEVALGLSLVGAMLAFETVKLPEMVAQQVKYVFSAGGRFDLGVPAWGILLQPIGFVLFFAAALAETKRAPFDVPEGESEIVGYFVEYSGMKFGMFMVSEFVEIVVLAGVLTTVFFGGYHLPFGGEWLVRQRLFSDYPILLGTLYGTVFWVKVLLLCWFQLLVRWTFPRFRYDQIQSLGWKILLPLGLANVFLTAGLVLWDPSLRAVAAVGALEIGLILVLTLSRKAEAHSTPHAPATAHPH